MIYIRIIIIFITLLHPNTKQVSVKQINNKYCMGMMLGCASLNLNTYKNICTTSRIQTLIFYQPDSLYNPFLNHCPLMSNTFDVLNLLASCMRVQFYTAWLYYLYTMTTWLKINSNTLPRITVMNCIMTCHVMAQNLYSFVHWPWLARMQKIHELKTVDI